MPELSAIPESIPLAKHIEERIRGAILTGQMRPHVLYTETRLAEQLGVSRTPVREAVLDLASRGFVTVLPRRGFHVRVVTQQVIKEIYELRWALESHAVRALAEHPECYDFSALKSAAAKQKDSAQKSEIPEVVASGRDFHVQILRLLGNTRICKIFDDVRDIIHAIWLQAFTHTIAPSEVVCDHEQLIQLMQKGDADEALALLREHLQRSERAVREAQRNAVKK